METGTELLLGFIIDKELDLKDFPTLEVPLRDEFVITDKEGNEATKKLLDAVIHWENNPVNGAYVYDSLETILNRYFNIEKRKMQFDNDVTIEQRNKSAFSPLGSL